MKLDEVQDRREDGTGKGSGKPEAMKLKITAGLAVLAVVGGVSAFLLRSDGETASAVSPVGTPPKPPAEPEAAPEPGPLALPPASEPAAPAAAEEPDPADELEALIEDQGKGATPRLLKVVGDPEQSPELRNMAVDALSEWYTTEPTPEVREAALRWMGHADLRTRQYAVGLSQEWQGEDLKKCLLSMVAQPEENTDVLISAAVALTYRRVVEVVPVLRTWLDGENIELKRIAILYLGTFKDPESKAKIESLARASTPKLQAAAKTSLIKYDKE